METSAFWSALVCRVVSVTHTKGEKCNALGAQKHIVLPYCVFTTLILHKPLVLSALVYR